jgi:hypothetical protein
MKCQTAERLFDDYATGNLPETTRTQLQEHMRSCASCRAQADAAQRLELQCAGLKKADAPDLRDRIFHQVSSPPGTQEKPMNKTKIGISLALATAVCAIALTSVLSIKPASAMTIVKRSIKAVQQVRTAKVITWYREGGEVHTRTVWSDDKRTREEVDGKVCVFKDGKTSNDPEHEAYISVIKPSEWTIESMLAAYRNAMVPTDLGMHELNGRQLRLIRFSLDHEALPPSRWDYYVDDTSNLPVQLEHYQRQNGDWVKVTQATYEFDIALTDSLFELPAGRSWHTVPNLPTGEVIGGVQEPLDGESSKPK